MQIFTINPNGSIDIRTVEERTASFKGRIVEHPISDVGKRVLSLSNVFAVNMKHVLITEYTVSQTVSGYETPQACLEKLNPAILEFFCANAFCMEKLLPAFSGASLHSGQEDYSFMRLVEALNALNVGVLEDIVSRDAGVLLIEILLHALAQSNYLADILNMLHQDNNLHLVVRNDPSYGQTLNRLIDLNQSPLMPSIHSCIVLLLRNNKLLQILDFLKDCKIADYFDEVNQGPLIEAIANTSTSTTLQLIETLSDEDKLSKIAKIPFLLLMEILNYKNCNSVLSLAMQHEQFLDTLQHGNVPIEELREALMHKQLTYVKDALLALRPQQ